MNDAAAKQTIGSAWNGFWYKPRDHRSVSALRILVGVLVFYFLLSHTADLTKWFAADGLLPVETIERINGPALFGNYSEPVEGSETRSEIEQFNGRFSLLLLTDSATQLWVLHSLAMICAALMIVGFRSRIVTPLTLLFVLSYIHRAPFLCGTFEPILSFSLLYLCFAPSGSYLSVDQRLASKAGKDDKRLTSTTTANLAIRLIQIHTVAIVAMMALTMLGSDELIIQSDEPLSVGGTWWKGSAVWDLINRSETRLIDLTWLASYSMLLEGWTHAIVLFELTFVVLVWSPLTRRIMLVLAIPFWISMAILTGQISFAAMMLVAKLSFVSTERWERLIPAKPD